MGMCKGCGKVFSALEMKDGYCKECLPQAEQEKAQKTENISSGNVDYDDAMIEAFVAKPEKLLWYKKSFAKFNVNGMPVMKWNWSWWAFFGGWAFLMYRKQYMAAFVLFIIEVVTSFMYLGLVTMILSGGYATYFIYKGYRVKVAEIENSVEDNHKRIDTMKQVGGYNGWAIGAKIVGLILQIFAIAIIAASIFGMNMDDFDSSYDDEYSSLYDEELSDNGFKYGNTYTCNGVYFTIAKDGSYADYWNSRYYFDGYSDTNYHVYKNKLGQDELLFNLNNKNIAFMDSYGIMSEVHCT